jgi:quaternary ammonium compound-resistance protein SugE
MIGVVGEPSSLELSAVRRQPLRVPAAFRRAVLASRWREFPIDPRAVSGQPTAQRSAEWTSAKGDQQPLGDLIMAWLTLIVAGLFEIGWAVGLKYSEGLTRLWPTVATAVALVLSMGLLALALRSLPLGTAYAVWTGIGTVGTAVLGMVLFREPATVARLVCIALIIVGIVGLKLVGE